MPEYTAVTRNYTTFVLPFIMSLFDFITPVMLSNAGCVCVCMCACKRPEIFASADFTWVDSEISSTCQRRRQPGCTRNSTTELQQVGDNKNYESTAGKTSPTQLAPLMRHPKPN